MTQKGWWLAIAPLALALAAPGRAADEKKAASPRVEVEVEVRCPPILTKLPYINKLFKKAQSECPAQKAAAPCEVKKGACPQGIRVEVVEVPTCCPLFGVPAKAAAKSDCIILNERNFDLRKAPAGIPKLAVGCGFRIACPLSPVVDLVKLAHVIAKVKHVKKAKPTACGTCCGEKVEKVATKARGCGCNSFEGVGKIGTCDCQGKKAKKLAKRGECCCEPGKCACKGCGGKKAAKKGCGCAKKAKAGCCDACGCCAGAVYGPPWCPMPAPVMMPLPPPMAPIGYEPLPAPPCWTVPAQVAMPLPPPMPVLAAPGKEYLVEMKLVDACPGKDDKVLMMPRCTVPEGEPFTVAVDDERHFRAMPGEGCPAKGGGNGVCLSVVPHKPGRVMVDVLLHRCRYDTKCGTDVVDWVSSVHMVKQVKLGEPTTFCCDHAKGEKGCRLVLTVKAAPDCGEEAAEVCTPPCVADCVYSTPLRPTVPVAALTAAAAVHPARGDKGPITFRIAGPKHGHKGHCCKAAPKQLEACCGGVCMVLDRLEGTVSGATFEVTVADGKVSLTGGNVSVKADRVTIDPDGVLRVEGCFEVKGTGAVKVMGGEVRVAPARTSIVPCPTLLP